MSTVLPVAQRGEAILSLTAAPVADQEFGTAWLHALAQALQATMLERNGVGIAAPQVYVSKRVIIVASRPNLRYPDAPDMQAVVMVNPEILHMSEQYVLGEEGCLSVPNERGQVARAEQIQVRYFSLDGKPVTAEFSGFPARIVQHEVDHLNSILFVERLGA
ncbi:peptide deformylase [Acinetobacter pragensis]|uniref:Peptide deformylase n=1 Tax=Acinetobacter pragensis TaxID=1806892 RepID=A0A151Y6Q1_9GAMM|nr:peptide deformylase [Acinetobacter pragensis]KYQ73721.1 peptide deformylase [Acinetobacter pragensis]